MKQYKILTMKDRYFLGKFDPEKLETALNAYASEGWTVVTSATAEIPSLGRNREELITVLERDAA
jgi:Domain of unknown function (DUF4177)